jgi:hypothetical protein
VREFKLENVYHVPNFAKTLLSVSTLVRAGHDIMFTATGCTVYHPKKCDRVTSVARDANGVYPLLTEEQAFVDNDVQFAAALSVLGTDLESWHRRYGHLNYKMLKSMAKNKAWYVRSPRRYRALRLSTGRATTMLPTAWYTPTLAVQSPSRVKATGSSWSFRGVASCKLTR